MSLSSVESDDFRVGKEFAPWKASGYASIRCSAMDWLDFAGRNGGIR
jgi:hypothetical protein